MRLSATVVGLQEAYSLACPLTKGTPFDFRASFSRQEIAMKPDTTKISIHNNLAKIKDFLSEVILEP